MGKFKLYPESKADRIFFWGIFVTYVLAVLYLQWTAPLWRMSFPRNFYAFLLLVFMAGALWVLTFVARVTPSQSVEDYTATLADIENISKKLSSLAEFLTRERKRVEESEATLNRLKNEKTELEPVVSAQRETVNAILTAHAKATASRAWKERALAFLIGVITSLLATLLYELFRSPVK
ncbi:MAG TPA: hypothetical protein VN843_29500 [Anaerolineales bacterium]|nr:hypothetical protein [Anaerolineales bacterium]